MSNGRGPRHQVHARTDAAVFILQRARFQPRRRARHAPGRGCGPRQVARIGRPDCCASTISGPTRLGARVECTIPVRPQWPAPGHNTIRPTRCTRLCRQGKSRHWAAQRPCLLQTCSSISWMDASRPGALARRRCPHGQGLFIHLASAERMLFGGTVDHHHQRRQNEQNEHPRQSETTQHADNERYDEQQVFATFEE